MLFEKKETIYKKKDRETFEEIRSALKAAGLKGISAGHYAQDAVMACGCGAKLDPRNFGAKGRVDHDVYYIRVRSSDVSRAQEILRQSGLVSEVLSSEELMRDASVMAAQKIREA